MPPTLGVLITYYNEGPLLTGCLDTLLSGPDKPDEILIYDDASSNPAEKYVRVDHSVRIIRGDRNVGIGHARNELIKASQSDFIHFQDADDFFDPSWCQKAREEIRDGEVDLLLNNTVVVDTRSGQYLKEKMYPLEKLATGQDLILFFLIRPLPLWVSMLTYRRRLALEIGGFLTREALEVVEDREFHMRVFALKPQYRVLDESLVIKNQRPNTLSTDHDLRTRREICVARIKVWKILLGWLPKEYHPWVALNLLRDEPSLIQVGETDLAQEVFWLAVKLGFENCDREKLTAAKEDVAQILFRNGVCFFRAGKIIEARTAFDFSRRYGPVNHKNRTWLYRVLIGTFGPELTEWFRLRYVKLTQVVVRKKRTCGKIS